jgi:hypothetical protein
VSRITETWQDGVLVATVVDDTELPPDPPALDEVFAAVPVVSLEEANDTLLALKAALEARGIV